MHSKLKKKKLENLSHIFEVKKNHTLLLTLELNRNAYFLIKIQCVKINKWLEQTDFQKAVTEVFLRRYLPAGLRELQWTRKATQLQGNIKRFRNRK